MTGCLSRKKVPTGAPSLMMLSKFWRRGAWSLYSRRMILKMQILISVLIIANKMGPLQSVVEIKLFSFWVLWGIIFSNICILCVKLFSFEPLLKAPFDVVFPFSYCPHCVVMLLVFCFIVFPCLIAGVFSLSAYKIPLSGWQLTLPEPVFLNFMAILERKTHVWFPSLNVWVADQEKVFTNLWISLYQLLKC